MSESKEHNFTCLSKFCAADLAAHESAAFILCMALDQLYEIAPSVRVAPLHGSPPATQTLSPFDGMHPRILS